jgi:hypothetical protein
MNTHLPWWNWVLQGIGFAVSYAGAEFNSRLDIKGFHLWLVANVTLLLVHMISGLAILAFLDVMYIRLNVLAIQRWRGAKKHSDPAAAQGSSWFRKDFR